MFAAIILPFRLYQQNQFNTKFTFIITVKNTHYRTKNYLNLRQTL